MLPSATKVCAAISDSRHRRRIPEISYSRLTAVQLYILCTEKEQHLKIICQVKEKDETKDAGIIKPESFRIVLHSMSFRFVSFNSVPITTAKVYSQRKEYAQEVPPPILNLLSVPIYHLTVC